MRTISADQEKVLTAAGGFATHVRVSVKDFGGTWRNVSDLEGYDWVESVSLSEGVDQPVASATVTLFREHYGLSLASLMGSSKMNAVYGGGPLLYINRAIKIETATTPLGNSPAGGDWVNKLEGLIDDVDWGTDRVQLACLDDGARLQKRYIEKEKIYGLGLTVGVDKWQPNTVVALGQKAVPTDAGIAFYWECTSGGTTAATEPDWVSHGGAAFADGTAQWTRVAATSAGGPVETQMQAILDETLGAGVTTLLTPASPGWTVTKWAQDRQPLLDALTALASQIGWDLRYKWHAGSSAHRLTFYEPDRSRVIPLRTFTADQYLDVKSLRVALAGIRNAVQIVWWDPAALDAAGQPKKKTALFVDASSEAQFGRQFCEISGTPNIDTVTEVNKLGNGVLADLAQPAAEKQVLLPYFWPAELGDLYGFTANNVHYDSDQTLAVVAIQHDISRDGATTTLTCRGKPAGGYKKWLGMESRPGLGEATTDQPPDGPQATSVTAVFGGAEVSFNEPAKSWKFKDGEIHISDTPAFTPSSATLYDSGRKRRFHVRGIPPGATKYLRVLLKDEKGQVAQSAEASFTAAAIGRSDLASALKTGFYATRAADVVVETGSGSSTPKQVALNSETWDVGAGYATGTSRYTAPETGKYRFQGQVALSGVLPGHSGSLFLKKNGATTVATGPNALTAVDPATVTNRLTMVLDTKLELTAGDYVELWYTTYTPGVTSATLVAAASFFSGEELMES